MVNALQTIAGRVDLSRPRKVHVQLPELPQLALTPRDAFYAKTESLLFAESAGRIAAEFVVVYPPGIPILVPGEWITQRNIEYIHKHLEAGLPVQGPEDHTNNRILVVAE